MAAERFWTPEEARAALDRVRELVEAARVAAGGASARSNGHGSARDQLDAALGALADEGIVVRDLERGLIDFPARSPSGRTYLLCWLVDEDGLDWWHWPDAGFAGRTPLSEPPG